MNTLSVIEFGKERYAIEYKNATHRTIYRKTLRAISRNELFEGKTCLRLISVSHTHKNLTKIHILIDNWLNCYINIHTIER